MGEKVEEIHFSISFVSLCFIVVCPGTDSGMDKKIARQNSQV